jgi:hypothetical protein
MLIGRPAGRTRFQPSVPRCWAGAGLTDSAVEAANKGLELLLCVRRRGRSWSRHVRLLPGLAAVRLECLVARVDLHHLRLLGHGVVHNVLAVRSAQPLPVARAFADRSRSAVRPRCDLCSHRKRAIVINARLSARSRQRRSVIGLGHGPGRRCSVMVRWRGPGRRPSVMVRRRGTRGRSSAMSCRHRSRRRPRAMRIGAGDRCGSCADRQNKRRGENRCLPRPHSTALSAG